jgi:hypothetical protein
MDTKQVIARFEAERQALALMDHPNIAKVLEAGQIGERRKELGDRSEDSESRMSPNSSLLTPLSFFTVPLFPWPSCPPFQRSCLRRS